MAAQAHAIRPSGRSPPYWFPTWLAQPAALVPGSKLIDAPPHHQSEEDVLQIASDYELVILHTSTPSLANDVECARHLKAQNPMSRSASSARTLPCCRNRPCAKTTVSTSSAATSSTTPAKNSLKTVPGMRSRDSPGATRNGKLQRTEDRELIPNWDAMPGVLPVYADNLDITKYFIGYLLHPYLSFYTGRGCPAKCTFCLWPQTIGGHKYRTKSPEAVGPRDGRGEGALWG